MKSKETLTPLQHARKWINGDLIKVKHGSTVAYHANEFEQWTSGGNFPRRSEKVPQEAILFFLGDLKMSMSKPAYNSMYFAKVWWKNEIFWVHVDEKLRLMTQGKPQVQKP